ncbi:synaptotagmin-like protein 2 [Grus americana]|uniref:synaptotagmin-like protein 2 n=1 Tax=Grus americana TaxID=9117 RepID=UPI00240877CA|nr:synaptotagmin-like protein 2 [Grus americana]
MIDLSFLTEEEQEAIMKVLQRDAELKRAEEERVRHLPEKVKDDVQLKNMSGQWFYEAKSKRHRDKIHGADIIRASMRRKPATLAEMSQNKSKNSWVSNVNKEVFVPPELHGIVEHQEEEPLQSSSRIAQEILVYESLTNCCHALLVVLHSNAEQSSAYLFKEKVGEASIQNKARQSAWICLNGYIVAGKLYARLVSYYAFVQYLVALESFTFVVCKLGTHIHDEQHQSSKPITSLLDKPEERSTKAAVSPVKQRRNPFNFTASGDNLNSGELENRPAILPQLSNKEILSPSKERQPKPSLVNDETEEHKKPSVEPTDESQKGLVKRPVPKARKLIHKATDPVSQREDFVPKPAKRTERINGIGTPPRGILKRSSSSSSTDSEVRVSQMLDVQKKNGLPTATIFEGEAEKNSLTEEAEDSTQISLEKLKQVRFSSSTDKGAPLQSPQLHHGREKGEFDLLESDEIKSGGNDAVRSDSSGNKQMSAVKPLGTYSSALQVKTIDGLQNDTLASGPCDTNRSVFLVNETLQTKTVTPKKLETPQKTSSNILPNSNNELSVDETCENEANQFLSHESKSHKNFTDEHQLSAKTEQMSVNKSDVSNTNSTSLQQGKLDLVEERHAKTTFKPDKHADELMKVASESVSKVLDWFKRSSGTEDRKHVSATSQGRETKEEVNFSTRTAVLPTEHSGPSMDGKTEVKEELPFGKIKQWNSISSTSFISEDTQLIKERMKPKKGEENEEQNDKSQTGFVCTRVEEKEHGQEIKRQNQISNLLVHQEHKLPAQKCELEKAIREKRRIREIRAFWERDKTTPSHGEEEVNINTNASGGCALKGLGESDKIKQTSVYLPNGLDDQSKNTLRSAELSCASQASRNNHQNSFEFGPGHAVEKPEGTLPSGEVHEYVELPKASNLQPSVGATSASPESKDKDEKEAIKGKVAACSQQKPSFQVLSLKEKMSEKSKHQISDPSQFQSLRNFWDTGVKLQSSLDRGGVSLPNHTSSIIYDRKSKEDEKGRDKQELIQQQTQTSEREEKQKSDSVVCELPLGSPTLKGLNVTHTKNTHSVQLDRKPVISKPQEKMDRPEQEVKECVEKNIVSSKEHHVSLQLLQSPGDKDALKEKAVDDWLCLPIEKVENKATPLEISLPKEEVAETVDKVVLPKAELDVFKLGLKKLEKEASEMSSSLNLKENILKGTTFHSNQCKVSERTVEESHDTFPADQKEEISKSTGEVIVPSTDENENKSSLRKLFREFEPFCLRHQPAEKDDALRGSRRPQAGLQNVLRENFASQTSEYRRLGMKTSSDTNGMLHTNCSVESTCQEDTGQPEEVNETTEKSVAPSKVSGLSSALEKLMKEATETPPPKPKRADGTVQRAAEMEVKSMTYENDGELPQEIRETIEKSVVPSQVSGLSSALEKLMKEATETPPPKPKRADGTVQRAAEMEVKSMTCKHDGELLQEIRETIEKSVVPSQVSGLSSALEKLLKEATETPPLKPKRADSTVQRAAEMEVKSMTYESDGELLQEIRETIEKSVVPFPVSGLSSALEKLLKEATEMPPLKPKCADGTVRRAAEMEVKSMTYEHDRELLQETGETVERSVLSKAEYGVLDVNLQMLPKEVSETPPFMLKNMNKKMQGKIQTSQSMHAPHEQERDDPQEIQETIEKTSVSNIAKFSEFSSSLEKLLQEASETSSPLSEELHKQEKFGDHMFPSQKETLFMTVSQPYNALSSYHTQMKIAIKEGAPEQSVKTSINDLTVSEIEASDLSKRNGASNKIEERNRAPVDPSFLEGETNMIAIKQFKINKKGRRGEITSLDTSENNSEFKALLKFRRASTPLKDESNSLQPEGAQLCLTSQHEDNDEEEGDGSHLGSKFSDENSDSLSGTRSSICSEEELNPVLMALKRSADRKMPSKSLEDIPSATSNKGKINNPKEELALSAEDGPKPDQHQERNENAAGISTVPSQPDKLFSNPEKLKGLSKSVPSFLQEESDDRETDTASESSYSLGRIKKSPSSLTNLSGSSGMASLSSVSGSLMSIYSADFGNVDVKGNIQFAIDYVEQLNELHVFICQCKDLAVADVKRQRSDPYVKTYLLPEKYKLGKRKTSVKKKTFNPVYNEILRYKIEKDLLKNQSLNISVWHNDTFGRNSFLGEVELDLGTWDWNDKSNKQINWFPLKPRTSTMTLNLENRGEMKLALQYVPHPVAGKKTLPTGEVHIWVKECHDLPLLRGNRLNSFIKCTVLPDTSRKSRQKTRTVAKTTNPVFNHTMVYDGFRPEDLKEACIELTVWDHNKLANHFLGGLRIGLGTGKSYGTTVDWMDSTSDETALWEKMMNSPNTWIEDTLPLRMLMVAKLTK